MGKPSYKTTGSSIIYRVTNEKSQVITLPVYAYLGTNVQNKSSTCKGAGEC